MGHKFAEIAFTESVRDVQQAHGSRAGYAALDQGDDYNHRLGDREAAFITARDSFYMASVSEAGWPYLQHRGGPAGFVHIIDERTIGFADYSGNRQYVSVGNFAKDDRVALFFMDYPNRTRLKMLGRVQLIDPSESESMAELEVENYRAHVERGVIIHIEAFDWNCPQHITPRYTDEQLEALMRPLIDENQRLQKKPATPAKPTVLGDGPLNLVITGVRQLTPRVRAYELRDPSGADLPVVEAGAHLQVPVQIPDGKTVIRHYSICSNPARRDIYEIAVLRDDQGSGGSVAVHELFDLGLHLHCELPKNHFPLHSDDRPAVLIAGGIGITPIKPMAQALKARGNALQLHYAGQSTNEMAFVDRLSHELGSAISLYRSARGERMDIERILSAAHEEARFYVCGPSRLIDAVNRAAEAVNIDTGRIHFERFEASSIADARPIQLQLHRSGIQLEVDADKSILDTILEAGIEVPYSCKTGSCKTCATVVIDGEPDHQDSVLSDVERNDARLICPCVSRARGDHLTLDI